MAVQLTALILFVAIFAIATLRGAHIGILMFASVCGVGVWLAGMPLEDVVGSKDLQVSRDRSSFRSRKARCTRNYVSQE